MMVFKIYQGATFANVVNFYLISILTLAIGAELFLKVYRGRDARLIMLLSGIIAAILILIAAFLINPELISLEPDSWMPFAYVLALFGIFYEFLEEYLGIAGYQIIYFSHFAFYAALSLMFLAYAKLSYLGEFYEEIKKIVQIGR